MADWKVTATTIYCDAVAAEATIIVYRDGTVKCSGYKKYAEDASRGTTKMLRSKGKTLGRELRCEGPECHRVTDYKDKVFAEEKGKN